MKQSVYYDRFPHYIPIPVNSVADLGEGLGGYSSPPGILKVYKKRYKNALIHINSCIKCHFYTLQNMATYTFRG